MGMECFGLDSPQVQIAADKVPRTGLVGCVDRPLDVVRDEAGGIRTCGSLNPAERFEFVCQRRRRAGRGFAGAAVDYVRHRRAIVGVLDGEGRGAAGDLRDAMSDRVRTQWFEEAALRHRIARPDEADHPVHQGARGGFCVNERAHGHRLCSLRFLVCNRSALTVVCTNRFYSFDLTSGADSPTPAVPENVGPNQGMAVLALTAIGPANAVLLARACLTPARSGWLNREVCALVRMSRWAGAYLLLPEAPASYRVRDVLLTRPYVQMPWIAARRIVAMVAGVFDAPLWIERPSPQVAE